MHTDFACLLFSMIHEKPPITTIKSIIIDAVDCEKEFITSALPVELIGMNSKSMAMYIEFVADRLLVALGCTKHYNTRNPFDWMELISLSRKTNFFERRVSEYQKSGVTMKGRDIRKLNFNDDGEFN